MRARRPSLPLVVFSDVDGVLTEPQAPTSAAAAALEPLARAHVPLILCSSRTRAEIEVIQQELGIQHPFVCESGGAVFVPRGYFGFDVPNAREVAGYQAVEFGRTYSDVVATLHRTAERLRIDIIGFSGMSVEEVSRDCQMPLLHARLAKLREYQEPFRVLDRSPTSRVRLIKALHAARLRCVARGRYDYAGAAVDNGLGVNLLCALYRQTYGAFETIGLADALADETLLQIVDHPIIVHDDYRGTGAGGVVEWAEGLAQIVQELTHDKEESCSR